MNVFGLRFHHLGLAVRNVEKARAFLKDLGYVIGEPVYDPKQNVNLLMCAADDMPDVEVVSPAEGASPIDTIIGRQDALIYHTCYTTECLDKTIAAIEQAGHRLFCVSEPKEAILFGGCKVSFYQIAGFGTIEIIDAPGGLPS